MTNEQYASAQKRLLAIVTLARTVDIDGFLGRISESEAVAPVIDPTLYMRSLDNMRALKSLAQAVKTVQSAGDALIQAVVETHYREEQRNGKDAPSP